MLLLEPVGVDLWLLEELPLSEIGGSPPDPVIVELGEIPVKLGDLLFTGIPGLIIAVESFELPRPLFGSDEVESIYAKV